MNSFENAAGGQPEEPGSVNPQAPQNVPGSQNPVNPQNIPNSQPYPPYHQNPAGQADPYGGQNYGGANVPPRHASPYADSPYMNPNMQQDAWGNPPYSPKPKKPKKPHSGNWGRRIGACALALALVAAGSGITALCLNNHWSNVLADIRQENDNSIAALQEQIEQASRVAAAGIGSPTSPDGLLTPSQVYAKNVGSVVAISSTLGQNRMGQVATGTGSGFILSEDGYVVTNHHVVEGAVSVKVITGDNTEYDARIVGQDAANDVAVLKIEAHGLPAVTVGSSNDLLIGDMVVAIGNPLGELTATQTVGYVCGKDRTVTTGGAAINMLQTDAAINAGNSGGPLFNMKGEVVGITTAKYSGTTGSGASIEGIGFAIPINDVLGIINDLVKFGYVTGAYLGVSVRDVDPQIASVYGIPMGAYIVEVVEDASADRAGLEPKDIVTKLGEYEIENSNDLIRALRHYKAGEIVTITYSRAGASHTADMKLDEKPQQKATTPTAEQQEIPVPSEGDYDEWFDYFDKFFGDMFGVPTP